MARPLTEHSTKLRTGKGARTPSDAAPHAPARSRVLEPVDGGRLRRIVFEGSERPASTPEPMPAHHEASAWRSRSGDDIDDIRFEVDNLHRTRSRSKPLDLDAPMETGSVYETDRGAIREARQGDRRVLYTARRTDAGVEERRFTSNLVDMVLAKKTPVEEETVVEESVEYVPRRRRVVEELPVDVPERAGSESATYQPQCVAVTRSGLQCRNSAKGGSELCGSHQDYTPASLADLTDTEPAVAGAEDTKAGGGKKHAVGGKQAQCGAYTKDGLQCRNSSRKGSKYCVTHKGYRAPTRAQLEARLDTKPRWAQAPDTMPTVN